MTTTTLFRTHSGTTYLFNHRTRVLSAERSTGITVEVVAVDGFDCTVGERCVAIGRHPSDPMGADGRGAWSINTSPVVWATTYTVTTTLAA